MIITLLYCMLIFAVIGGIGMAIGTRHQPLAVKKQRWLKFAVYLLVITVVLVSILYKFFFPVALLIVILCSIEFYRACLKVTDGKRGGMLPALAIYILIITGFLFFAIKSTMSTRLFAYTGVIIFDAFSQIAGQIFGRTALIPSVSPAKTWEGFWGGVIFCVITSLGIVSILQQPLLYGVAGGILTALFAFAGDVLASLFKRKAGIKDYSNWLPGQGGFLDRFDSFLFAGAAYYLLKIIFVSSIL